MRKRLFDIIESADEENKVSRGYDIVMMVAIFFSLVPLAFKQDTLILYLIDKITVGIFIVDYLLRYATADYKRGKKGVWSFVKYPFSPMALIDLISILPSLTIVNNGLKLFRLIRFVRTLRILRIFKLVRYSKSVKIIINVLGNTKESLMAVCTFAIAYILISALVIFNVEPDSFDTFFDAIYWATVSLTTVGYGDIYPVSDIGRVVTMVSSIFGVAIIALPAGIVTAGYMDAIEEERKEKQEKKELLENQKKSK